MNKLSLRLRITILTAICLTVSSVLMSAILFRMVDTQIVEPIAFGTTNKAVASSDSNSDIEFSEGEAIIIDSNDNVSGESDMDTLLHNGVQKFRTFGVISLFAVVLVGSLSAWFVAGLSIKPVHELSKKMKGLDEKDLSFRISDCSANDEISELSRSFNTMLERLETAFLREKRFSAAAAHELKTPIAVMRSSIDVLELSDKPNIAEYKKTVFYCKKQVERLFSLSHQLLDFSSQSQQKRNENISLSTLIQEIIQEHQQKATKKVTFHEELSDCTLYGNEVMFRQAISNLIDNAIKYGGENPVVLVELKAIEYTIELTVADHGQGIKAEAVSHIFEPFYREDKSRSRQIGGAGLGLALVKETVEQHGGSISYTPNTPNGSRFTIIFSK